MFTNRITAYLDLAEDEHFPETSMLQNSHLANNPLVAPANFAPIPKGLLGEVPPDKLAWQQELYRMAYQSALAAMAASDAFRRAQKN